MFSLNWETLLEYHHHNFQNRLLSLEKNPTEAPVFENPRMNLEEYILKTMMTYGLEKNHSDMMQIFQRHLFPL